MTARVRRRRVRDDRGAVLVEAAFVLPVFLLLIFGVIEFGLYFGASATTVSTTREAARYGSASFGPASNKRTIADQMRDLVVKDLGARTGQDTPVRLWIYRANTNGFPDSGTSFASCATSCFQYAWSGSTFAYQSGSWSNPDACQDNSGTPDLDSIGVYLEVRHAYATNVFNGIIGSTSLIAEKTVSQLEPIPIIQCASG